MGGRGRRGPLDRFLVARSRISEFGLRKIGDRQSTIHNLQLIRIPKSEIRDRYRPPGFLGAGASVGSRPSFGAPVPDDPMNSLRPSAKVTSRPFARFSEWS